MRELGISRDAHNDAHKTAVGSQVKIGIIGLDTLRALTRWQTHFDDQSVKEAASCDGTQNLTGLPPAPNESKPDRRDQSAGSIESTGDDSSLSSLGASSKPRRKVATAKRLVSRFSQPTKQKRGGRS
jgi:hypothetical protein